MSAAPIRTAAVLGAGVMGAQIAAHLANGGVDVTLFDVTLDAARQGLARLVKLRPDPLFTRDLAARITPASLDDLAPLARADWVIEAVVERLDVKQALIARVEGAAGTRTIVSTNTSALSIDAIAMGRRAPFRAQWLGTHFFNPPRYLHLVELIPTADTDGAVVERLQAFLDLHLGKGVVMAPDSPGFIANRLGLFGVVRLLEEVSAGRFTIEEIDAITGPAIGRPKSATFRTIDIAGLDVLAAVARDLVARLPADLALRFQLPAFVDRMLARGLVGEKSGGGFYTRVKAGDRSEILTLDLDTLEYRAASPASFPSLEAAGPARDTTDRLKRLFEGTDRVGDLLRRAVTPALLDAVQFAEASGVSIDDVDRAMRWGFGWELGPIETIDAIGMQPTRHRSTPLAPAAPDLLLLHSVRAANRVVKSNAGASLLDLGDGVLGLEFHSKMNTIGGDTIAMIDHAIAEAAANWSALVIGSESDLFSAGANLMLLLLEAQDGNWDEVDAMVRAFQRATMAIKTSAVPVVVAPLGLALGGGCEIALHADRIQAAAETYIGLVEVGVGLLPAGGGTKEMLLRALDRAGDADPRQHIQETFETMALAKVSSSGAHGRTLGYLRDVDAMTMNRERVIADAKTVARSRAQSGYVPPSPRTAIPVLGDDIFARLSLGVHLAQRAGRATEHDGRVSRALARVLSGGDLAHTATVGEVYLLDLEREAFLSLCGESKTLERIGYTLKTGKTLRN